MTFNKKREKIVNITDFTKTPGARYKSDGNHSGEQFRDQYLVPLFEQYSIIKVNLDGIDEKAGYATSFLEEAFGGLARKFGRKAVEEKICIIANEDENLEEEILGYIADVQV